LLVPTCTLPKLTLKGFAVRSSLLADVFVAVVELTDADPAGDLAAARACFATDVSRNATVRNRRIKGLGVAGDAMPLILNILAQECRCW